MVLPHLDEATQKALNELTDEEIDMNVSYAYSHEVLSYGVQAVAHTHLMRMARDISEGKLSLDDFIKKYGLEFGKGTTRILVKIDSIKSDGIFFPKQGFCSEKRTHFYLFDKDHRNRVWYKDWKDKKYAEQLIDRIWQSSDLENPELVEKGIKFGKDMWQTCVTGFHRYKNGADDVSAQSQKVTDLGEKLIAYYSAIVEPTPSKS